MNKNNKRAPNNPYIILNEVMNDTEREGLNKIFTMMRALRQQKLLRYKYEICSDIKK